MSKLIRITTITYLLLIVTIQLATPNLNQFNIQQAEKKSVQKEKKIENQYIAQDTQLTRKISLKQFTSDFSFLLKENPAEAIKEIKKNYPNIELLRTYTESKFSPHTLKTPYLEVVKESPIYIENEISYSNLEFAVRKGSLITHYVFKIPEELTTHIQMKQQSRMYTVTHLQNNKWKTIPTEYEPKKKLSLGIEQNLPDLKPGPETKGISHYIQNEVLIKFKSKLSDKELKQFLTKYDLQLKNKLDHTIVAYCPKRSTKTLIKTLENDTKVEYLEPHFIYLTNKQPSKGAQTFIPNDRLYSDYQWNLPMIFTEQGWSVSKGKEDIIIAVIDTGVDLTHPEFKGKLVKGLNVVNPNKSPMDDDGHGTHVAGIISANINNGQGIAGITWYNKIMPIKVLDQSGAGTLFDVAQGIIWATDHGADVINLSLGNYAESKYLHDAIRYAHSKNVVLVAATGNDNTNKPGFPASYPEVMGVSAVDPAQQRAEFSNYGNDVDVVAPGVNIASTYPNNQYAALSGTSMASPHVAALAGLLKSSHPELSNKEISNIIKNTATDLGTRGKDPYFGYGEIHILNAINLSNEIVQKKEKAMQNGTKNPIPTAKEESFFQKWFRNLFR